MRDINGDNNGTIYDKSTTVVLNSGEEYYKDTPVEKEEISIKKILIEKIVEAIIGGILALIASWLGKYLSSDQSTNLQLNIHLILLGALLLCAIGAFVLIVAFVIDLVHIFRLKRNGKFIEFASKKDMVNTIINQFKSDEVKSNIRSVGKVYKNIDGKVFLVKSKKCPFCKSKPIGDMHLIRDVVNGEYIWVCSEQTSHRISFDYKENF